MANVFELVLNGRQVRVEDCSTNLTLLEYLRRRGLTGSKEGCAEGDCGACSVAIVERDAQGGLNYRAINSCLVPLCLMAGREVITVEGVAGEAGLHPVQAQMVRHHGSQCGYCTPGFILSMFEGHYRDDLHTAADLEDQLCGNLCRCTGYRPIRDAALGAFTQRHTHNGKDAFAERLTQACPSLGSVEYATASERFFRPGTLAELFRLKRQFSDAVLIAGATELGLEITKRFKTLPVLIAVEAVPELRQIQETSAAWHIGAAATLTEIQDALGPEFPALNDMLRVFGSRQVRNRATMGGNLVTASPIGDSAPVLLALDAEVMLVSAEGERRLSIDQFFLAYRKTALQPGEILKTIIVPRGVPAGVTRGCAWFKVSKRREMDISTVGGCFRIDVDRDGIIHQARLAYGGVAAMPIRARKTEQALLKHPWGARTVQEVLPVLRNEFTPISDVRGSAEYRAGLVTGLFERFFAETQERNRAGSANTVADSDPLFSTLKEAQPNPPVSYERHSNSAGRTESSVLGQDRREAEESAVPDCAVAAPHESAHKHVTGAAIYTDDQVASKTMLEVWPVCAPHARARILKRDVAFARQMPGIRAVLLAEDIPGINDVGPGKQDEVLFADREISFHGQLVAVVVGESQSACRAATERVVVEYEPLAPILTLRQALAAGSFHTQPNFIRRGTVDEALAAAPETLEGEFEVGGQDHFYLETHAAWAEVGEDQTVSVVSSTQHPSEVQTTVAQLLRLPVGKVVVQSPRMGGGFGGKETQAAMPAALAALGAWKTGQSVRVRLNRDQDMMLTGHRHPFLARFKVGFDRQGQVLGARIHLWSNGGWSQDLSQAVTDRALFHLDNAYYIPAVEFRGQVAKTNVSSNTAMRGFGAPQAMVIIEEILDRIARALELPPALVRERNLYRGEGETNTTHYGQLIGDDRIQTIWRELKASSRFDQRQADLATWNSAHPHRKRGIAITPVKFGISFTLTHLNQAGALVLIYQDGSVQVNHGGTEMGQGLQTNVRAIAANELGLPPEQIRLMPTSTDKVPNTSATAASVGTDLNGAAVKNACEILRARLLEPARALLKAKLGQKPGPGRWVFSQGEVFDLDHPDMRFKFVEVVRQAHAQRVSLAATGFYATPGIHWDRAAGRGKPFHYFACGAAVTEVEVDGFTGMHRLLRVDILHDAGQPINAAISRGQIEGGYIQGLGWLTTEELKWNDQGHLLTHSPDTYKIPSFGDTPAEFNVTLLANAAQQDVVWGSKAVGEPPFMLAISAREAIRDAVAAFGSPGSPVELAAPSTCEAIWTAIQQHAAAHQRRPRTETALNPG